MPRKPQFDKNVSSPGLGYAKGKTKHQNKVKVSDGVLRPEKDAAVRQRQHEKIKKAAKKQYGSDWQKKLFGASKERISHDYGIGREEGPAPDTVQQRIDAMNRRFESIGAKLTRPDTQIARKRALQRSRKKRKKNGGGYGTQVFDQPNLTDGTWTG